MINNFEEIETIVVENFESLYREDPMRDVENED